MNSAEQKEYEFIQPSEAEVGETITIIQSQLTTLEEKTEAGKGYLEAIRLLSGNKTSYEEISTELTSDVSRAIAVLAINYLNGECSREILLALEK